MKILAFAGSISKHSINKTFVTSVSKYYENPENEIEILDLNNFEMPIYSIDRELEGGIPPQAHAFAEKMDQADFLLISLAEHNGSYAAGFKNLIDWTSRIPNRKLFNGKPVFLLSTAPGAMGGSTVLSTAVNRFPWDGANVLESFSLPEFGKNFEEGKGVIEPVLRSQLETKIRKTKKELAQNIIEE